MRISKVFFASEVVNLSVPVPAMPTYISIEAQGCDVLLRSVPQEKERRQACDPNHSSLTHRKRATKITALRSKVETHSNGKREDRWSSRRYAEQTH
jgi:hypothetical protein